MMTTSSMRNNRTVQGASSSTMPAGLGSLVSESTSYVQGWFRTLPQINRRYQHGFEVQHPKEGTQQIMLDDIESFSYACTVAYFNGAPQGRHYSMSVLRRSCQDKSVPFEFHFYPIRAGMLTTVNPDPDPTVEGIQADIVATLYRAHLAALQRGERVLWSVPANLSSIFFSKQFYLTPAGIEVEHKQSVALITFDQITEAESIVDDSLVIRTSHPDLPKLSVMTSGPNFFPGFAILLDILADLRPADPGNHAAK